MLIFFFGGDINVMLPHNENFLYTQSPWFSLKDMWQQWTKWEGIRHECKVKSQANCAVTELYN